MKTVEARSGGKGVFIVLEGVEGAGKSTQAALLGEWLQSVGESVTVTREPGGTPIGEAIRSVLLSRTDLAVGAQSELLLILAARAAFVRDVVRPALERGDVVVADRYELSTFAYQGYGRGLDLDVVRQVNAFATAGLRSDFCVVLDITTVEGRTRQARAGKLPDRIEKEPHHFMDQVAAGYRELAATEPGTQLVDGSGGVGDVQRRIREAVAARFPLRFASRTEP